MLLFFCVFCITSGSGVEGAHRKLRKAGNPKPTLYWDINKNKPIYYKHSIYTTTNEYPQKISSVVLRILLEHSALYHVISNPPD